MGDMGRHVIIGSMTFLFAALTAAAQAEQLKVLTALTERLGTGTTAFIDTVTPRVIEIDASGKVVWQCSLAAPPFRGGDISKGADLEWVSNDDTFLVVIPLHGIFRINRKCSVTWRHLTAKVSHDADLLPNGNVIYVFGWDSERDAQVTEIDAHGKVVWTWQSKGKLDPSWRVLGEGALQEDRPSFAHTNAVTRLADGDTLVSLRNFHRVVRVAPDGSVRKVYGPLQGVHDPNLLPDDTVLAMIGQPMSVVRWRNGVQQTVFYNRIGIRPIRTVQPLQVGNLLLTGGEDIVEIDGSGNVVWRVKVYADVGPRKGRGVYKAVRIVK
jgi:hypothetical protein